MLRAHLMAVRLWLNVVLVLVLALGPVGSVGALAPPSADGCEAGCPCDPPADSDPCADEHDESTAEHADAAASSVDCPDNCTECDCDGGVVTAVVTTGPRAPRAGPSVPELPAPRGSLASGQEPDIFVPPRARA